MRRPFLYRDLRDGLVKEDEVDYRTNYSGDGGRCKFCGKYAPILISTVIEDEDEDDEDEFGEN